MTRLRVGTKPSRDDLVAAALVVVAVTPIVVAAVRALARGWSPIGDNGLILLRAQDVGTSHHPLLGTWTSASLTTGRNINNPGPLWFDWLAPFVRVFGPSVGMALGVMVANVAAVVLAAWAARRAGGPEGLAVVTALSAGLAWTLGSELLFDAWQPNAMVLPFWALVVCLWAVASGKLAAAPWAVGVASLIVQTHLSFVYVVAVTGVAAIVGGAVEARERARAGASPAWRRPLAASAIVAAALWLQPVIDQVFGQGNLGKLLTSAGEQDAERIGVRLGVRLVASVVALPPWWARPSYSETIRTTGIVGTGAARDPAEGDVASLPTAVVGVLLVGLVLGAVVVLARRRGDQPAVALASLGVAAVLGSVAALVLSPLNTIGLTPHQMRWLWPVATLVLAAPLFAVARWVSRPLIVTAAGGVVTAVLAVLALPTYAAPEGPTADRAYQPAVQALVDQLDSYDPGQPVLFDIDNLRFAEPYSGPVLAALGRHGVDVVVDDPGMVRQLGEDRRADGTETRRLVLLEGRAALESPPDAVTVAFVDGLTDAERDELRDVRRNLVRRLSRDGLRLSAAGRDARAAGRINVPDVLVAPGDDAAPLAAGGDLATLIRNGYVEIPQDLTPLAARYAELTQQGQTFTVGLFERPRR